MILKFEGSLISLDEKIVSTFDVENGERYPSLYRLKAGNIYNHSSVETNIDLDKISRLNFINSFGVTIGDSIVGLNVCNYIKTINKNIIINIVRPCTTTESVEEVYSLAKNVGLIDEIKTMPYPLEDCQNFDLNIDHGNQIYRKDFNGIEMHDYFFKHSGLNMHQIPESFKSNQWLKKIKKTTSFYSGGYVLFCPNASTPLRAIPIKYHKQIIHNLYQKFRKPILGFSPVMFNNYTNISMLVNNTSGYINMIRNASYVYTCDSSALHIAAGFDIPSRAIFTSIDPSLRLKYYRNIQYDYIGDIKTTNIHSSNDKEILKHVDDKFKKHYEFNWR